MMGEYSWKNGAFGFKKHDANEVGKELTRIREKRGKLDPSDVVEEASDRRSPLHPIFPWSEKEAARIGREAIAASLIRSIRVKVETVGGKTIDTRAFVSVKDPENKSRTYQGIEEALGTEEGRAYLIRQAWLQLKSWRHRYADLTELAEVFDAIDRAMEKKAG